MFLLNSAQAFEVLKFSPISMYTCHTYNDNWSLVPSGTYSKQHYYHLGFNQPNAVPVNENKNVCHDINIYSSEDSSIFPRLGKTDLVWFAWDLADGRFADNDSDGRVDINQMIEKRLIDQYDQIRTVNLFRLLELKPSPTQNEIISGVYMSIFFNAYTGRSFCPGREHYNSDEPLFSILKHLVGLPTEKLVLAKREQVVILDSNGNRTQADEDYLFITEGQANSAWFYYQNGIPKIASSHDLIHKKVYIHYPFDKADPFKKKPHQKTYSIEREIGCVPKLN